VRGEALTGLDDTDGDGLTHLLGVSADFHATKISIHVTDGETAEGRVVRVGLDTDRLLRDELDNGGVTGLDELGAEKSVSTSSCNVMRSTCAASMVFPVLRSISVARKR
jgi:hypothetical protein